MRPGENVRAGNVPKAKAKSNSIVQGSTLIRLPVKKIYCSKCQKLIRGKVQGSDNASQITCPKCGQSLWSWRSTAWRYPSEA